MEPISNIDRIVALLRQRLEQRGKARAGASAHADSSKVGGQVRMDALAALADIDGQQLRRTFVQTLLADQLGAELINDAQFQQVVTRVTDAIESDEASARLLSRLIGDARTRAKASG